MFCQKGDMRGIKKRASFSSSSLSPAILPSLLLTPFLSNEEKPESFAAAVADNYPYQPIFGNLFSFSFFFFFREQNCMKEFSSFPPFPSLCCIVPQGSGVRRPRMQIALF